MMTLCCPGSGGRGRLDCAEERDWVDDVRTEMRRNCVEKPDWVGGCEGLE